MPRSIDASAPLLLPLVEGFVALEAACWPTPIARVQYVADDRHVVLGGRPRLDILPRQNEAGGAVRWLRTSKVPVKKGPDVVGTIGGFEIISAEKARLSSLKRGA